jgi:hypothetical protein
VHEVLFAIGSCFQELISGCVAISSPCIPENLPPLVHTHRQSTLVIWALNFLDLQALARALGIPGMAVLLQQGPLYTRLDAGSKLYPLAQ